ncbi:MAG TPA: BMP family ABC transporter substrate-binding protein [Miltoncostaeaceae bacterium]|mgnify:CR=1 FL=1|nr:BMP family ABC transporter substrate-binding protein [Miltoncostaeaceae bacterium]
MRPPGRLALALLAALAAVLACAATAAPGPRAAHADQPDVVLVTGECASGNFLCSQFIRAAKRTGTRARIVSPDVREDIVGTLSLLARQGHDLVMVDFLFGRDLAEVAPRFPAARFGLLDAPLAIVDGAPGNVAAAVTRPHEASYLAGWLAARLERRRRGPDVVGVVGGEPIPPVQDFVIGFRAGAKAASPGVRVLIGYSDDFVDPTKCAAVARRQIARGAGTVFDVAGGCGPGTLAAAKAAGVWAIGVDADRSGLGPHILTSVVKRYDREVALMMRGVANGNLRYGRTTVLGLKAGGAELGRISRRVPAPVLAELAAVRTRIVSGRIRVPGITLPRP